MSQRDIRNYTVYLLHEAISPLTHASGNQGNESLVMREPVVSRNGVVWVPVLSGNALRHRCIRAPGSRWLVERLQLRGSLSWQQLNFLFHGGNLTEGGGSEDTRVIASWRRLFPLGYLLGGSLPKQILTGALLCGRGTLICEENRQALTGALPPGWSWSGQPLRPAEAFVSGYQYTRGDASRSNPVYAPQLPEGVVSADTDTEPAQKSNLMIFSGQAVTRGACFWQTLTLPRVSRLELGALLLSLTIWQEEGGAVGGKAGIGHGRLRSRVHVEGCDDSDLEVCVAEYEQHVEACAAECRTWLQATFTRSAEKPARGKKATKGKTEAEEPTFTEAE